MEGMMNRNTVVETDKKTAAKSIPFLIIPQMAVSQIGSWYSPNSKKCRLMYFVQNTEGIRAEIWIHYTIKGNPVHYIAQYWPDIQSQFALKSYDFREKHFKILESIPSRFFWHLLNPN